MTITDVLNLNSEAYIQKLQKDIDVTPNTSWENIFENMVYEFLCYTEDEASSDECGKTIADRYKSGEYNEFDINNCFENYIMFLDANEYDY